MGRDLPLVSIMIPTYNQEKFISTAVESALAQSYENLEVIVADDCSADATLSICEKFSGNPRFRYVRNATNLGRVENYRHTLYEKALGAWCLNLDGDDYLSDRDFVAEAMKVAETDPDIVLVWGNAVFAWEGQQFGNLMSKRINGPIVMSGKDAILQHAPFLSDISIPHLASVYKRDVALRADFYRDPTLCCDSESLYRLGFGWKIAIIDRVAGVWLQHGKNDSRRYRDQILGANKSRASGIAQWAVSSGAFSDGELLRLNRLLRSGCGVATFAQNLGHNPIVRAPIAIVQTACAYPMESGLIIKWAAQRGIRLGARYAAQMAAKIYRPHASAETSLVYRVPEASA